MIGLLRAVREHETAVEADLQRYYQVDYTDRWRRRDDGTPRLSWRRLTVLLRHLPPESAWAAAITGRDVPDAVSSAVMHLQETIANQHRGKRDKAWEHPILKALRGHARATSPGGGKRDAMREQKRLAALARKHERESQHHSDGAAPA